MYVTTALISAPSRASMSGVCWSAVRTPQICGIRVWRKERGSRTQRTIHSSLVLLATFERSGPTLRRSSQPLILWQPKQPYFSTSRLPTLSFSAFGTSTTPRWHFRHCDSTVPLDIMGRSH